ncbi:MAG: response regulator [Chloroflexota bacterium]|nr:response regulator transcription factor [Chloroflexota bacterium]
MKDLIVLVDDDENLSDMLLRTLIKKGFSVQGCKTVAEGLAALDVNPLDLAVVDIALPDGEGWEVVRALRSSSRPELADLPIMMISSFPPDRKLLRQLKVTAYLQKPFATPDFVEQVQSLVN